MSVPAIVFVHGIRSECGTAFPELRRSIESDRDFDGWELLRCEYDWGYGVRAGARRMHEVLDFAVARAGEEPVYIVAHSMGGLVARAALLEGSYPTVRRLVMVATPNFGAISTAQLYLFWQPIVDAAYAFHGIYPKKQAYHDLTHVYELFRAERDADLVLVNEYATVPAEYFHAERKVFSAEALSGENRQFFEIAVVAQLVSGAFPTRTALARPHDGIVAERSVSLIPSDPEARWSEKSDAINSPNARDKTYAHVVHKKAGTVNHNTILRSPVFIGLIKELILCDSLREWEQSSKPGRAKSHVTMS
jgi:pimeloyl-ACP methyl ester carboxylesterase